MDLLEILPWGREEAEEEKAFLSEAWLSTPMLEENNNDHSTAMNINKEKTNAATPPEQEHENNVASESWENNESFAKWMEMNDMELAMYQQNVIRQGLSKDYVEACDWDSSDSGIPDPTQALLQEFETVCEEYHGTLTPPHSRTPSPPPTTRIQYIPHVNEQPAIQLQATPVSYPIDLAQELALLEELVRDRAEALENTTPAIPPKCILTIPQLTSSIEMSAPAAPVIPVECITVPMQAPAPVVNNNTFVEVIVPNVTLGIKIEQVSPSLSPASLQEVPASSEDLPSPSYYLSPTSVTPSSPGSPRPNTPASSSCSEEASDPEWVPMKVIPRRQRSKPYSRNSKTLSSGYSSSDRSELSPGPSTSRGRRASRVKGQAGTEDRKERKKEQNKNAATRYRQKKKAEAEEVALEENELENKNDGLRAKAADLAREVSYLKKLMKEMFKARGLL